MSVAPPQIVVSNDGAEFVITGTGFTVAVTTYGAPGHPLDVGVIVYVTVPAVIPFVLVRLCAIGVPVPLEAPLTFEALAVHAYVVGATPFGVVIPIDVVCPEQMV